MPSQSKLKRTVSPRGSLSLTATAAKNEFGRALDEAIRGNRVVITKRDTPKAVLISMEEYQALTRSSEAALATLSAEYDGLFARFQQPAMRRALDSAFQMSPEDMSKAAVKAARKRG